MSLLTQDAMQFGYGYPVMGNVQGAPRQPTGIVFTTEQGIQPKAASRSATVQSVVGLVIGIMSAFLGMGAPYILGILTLTLQEKIGGMTFYIYAIILALVCIALAITGLILAVLARKKCPQGSRALATAALAVNIVALCFGAVWFVTCAGMCSLNAMIYQ